MGFSLWGAVISVAVLTPNLLLPAFPPRRPLPSAHVPWPLTALERAGQALCLVIPAITEPGGATPGWAILGIAALGGYLAL